MKKGCFISFVVIFTLIVGLIVYFIKYKKDFLKDFSKTKLVEIAVDEVNKQLAEVNESQLKDSLKNDIHNFAKNSKSLTADTALSRVREVLKLSKVFFEDREIDSTEYREIKRVFNRYERPKKN